MKNTGADVIGEVQRHPLRGIEAVALGASYLLFSLVLMIVNTAALGLGDPKFGSEGWHLYWPLWAAVFSPVVIVVILVRTVNRPIHRSSWRFYLLALVVILVAMEASFVVDLGWSAALAELTVLCIGAYVFGRQHSRHDG